jgi:hypothetical protein
MIETARAFQWLYETLTGDSQLQQLVGDRVYRFVAPPRAEMPYIVFQFQAGRDVEVVGATRILSQIVCVVRVVGLATAYATLKTIADRVDAVLQAASGEAGDGYVYACTREAPLDFPEADGMQLYQHVGGQYRLLVGG